MIKNRKKLVAEEMPEFDAGIENMPEDSKIFVDKSLEIADFIFWIMEQKGMKQKDLAEKMGKSEAEVSKFLAGMHNYTLRSISKIESALDTTVICTPRTVRVSFPVGSIKNSKYHIVEKKQNIHFSAIQYDTKVISMSGKNLNHPEPIAI